MGSTPAVQADEEGLGLAAAVPWWRRLANRFWGYDFFVSYHWASGGEYAVQLADKLRERRFDCFLDRSEFAGGDDWQAQARQALANTQRLIVVGTREALADSEPVHREVSLFSSRSARIIPILFGERIPDDERDSYPAMRLISTHVVEILEDAENLATGPSERVLQEIERGHSVLRRRRLRAVVITAALAVLALTALVATGSFLNARRQRGVAEQALMETQRELAQSLVDEGVREVRSGDRVGLLRLRRAYEIARRIGPAAGTDMAPDEAMSRGALRLLAGSARQIGLVLHHDEDLHSAELAPDSEWVRTHTVNIDGEPTGYEFWDARTGRALGVRIGVDDSAPDLRMSPDGSTAIHWRERWRDDPLLRRWDLRTGEMRRLEPPLPEHTPDGKWGLQASGGTVEIWDLESGRLAHTVRPAFGPPGRVRFSAQGDILIARSPDRSRVELFELETGRSLGAPVEVPGKIATVRVAAGGRWCALVLEEAGLWLGRPAHQPHHTAAVPPDPALEVHLSPSGETLLAKGRDRTWLLEAPNGELVGELLHESRLELARFSPDGRLLATADGSGDRPRTDGPRSRVQVWDAHTGRRLFDVSRRAEAREGVAFSPDSSLLLVPASDGFRVYDARTGAWRGGGSASARPCAGRGSRDCWRAAFAPDGRAVYLLDWRQRVASLVQARLPELVLAHPERTSVVALSADATRLLIADREGGARLWDLETEAPIGEPLVGGNRIAEARFSADGRWVVTDHLRGLKIWDVETGRGRPWEDDEGADGFVQVELGRAGALLAIRDDEGRLWDFDLGELEPRRLQLASEVGLFTLSPDGRRLATTSYGDDVLVTDLTSGRRLQVLNPRGGAVQDLQESESVEALAFTPDAAMLVTSTSYGTMRLWDVETGRLVRELEGPPGPADELLFSPDGEVIASLHGSGVRLWDAGTGQPIEEFGVWRAAALAFSADGRHLLIATPEATFRWPLTELPDEPERIRPWVDVLSVARWGEDGPPTAIGRATWDESWDRLAERGGPFR